MCMFFSCISDGKGNVYYFDSKIRKQILNGSLDKKYGELYDTDSHTSIAHYFGYTSREADRLNKYEYNPINKKFVIDQINTNDDSAKVRKFCRNLDFSKIVPELIIQKTIHPLKVKRPEKISNYEIGLFNKWIKIEWGSRNGIYKDIEMYISKVNKKVGPNIRNLITRQINELTKYNYTGTTLYNNVSSKINRQHCNYLQVGYIIDAYKTSFFNVNMNDIKNKDVIEAGAKLFKRGLIPSFDGETWRLHMGAKAKIVYEKKVKL